jgi:predicted dithiol-disulfide oxidoreductase (DUF899 family)
MAMLHGSLANETEEYRKAREELLEAEIALRDQRERVAALRRKLPPDTVMADYALHEGPASPEDDGPAAEVRLTDLFRDPSKPLVVYQYMFGGAQKRPCPMCTLWVDGFNGIAQHLNQRLNFALIAEARMEELHPWTRRRGWRDLRVVSSAGTSFKQDLGFADAAGRQHAGLSVFVRSAYGGVRHFYSAGAEMKPKEFRGIDLMTPFWNVLDLTPSGRGDWEPKLEYDIANVQKH